MTNSFAMDGLLMPPWFLRSDQVCSFFGNAPTQRWHYHVFYIQLTECDTNKFVADLVFEWVCVYAFVWISCWISWAISIMLIQHTPQNLHEYWSIYCKTIFLHLFAHTPKMRTHPFFCRKLEVASQWRLFSGLVNLLNLPPQMQMFPWM